MAKTAQAKECQVSKGNIYIMLALCIVPIILSIALNISMVYAFAIGIISCIIISLKSGFSTNQIKKMIYTSIVECKDLYIIILLIGANVSVWLASGVVPTLIYYGLQNLAGVNFLLASFLFIALTSVFMGTAVGTISTIGLAILGLGKGFGVPTHILVGVIVSGSFLADKISPMSGLLNLNLKTTDTNYKQALKSYAYTLIPTLIICSVAYYFMGSNIQVSGGGKTSLEIMNNIKENFVVSPYLLLLPVLTIILSFKGVKSVYCLLTGVIAGILISIFIQGDHLFDVIKYAFLGFSAHTPSQSVNNILTGGGLLKMVSTVLIVFGALSISTILQETGIIRFLTKEMVDKINSKRSLILKTSFISSFLTILTCDQTAGIIIPPQLLKDKYKEFGLDNNVLSRTISDTGTIIAPILPWNVNALIISLVTGVSCVSYAPYAMLCFITPIITIILAFLQKDKSKKEC